MNIHRLGILLLEMRITSVTLNCSRLVFHVSIYKLKLKCHYVKIMFRKLFKINLTMINLICRSSELISIYLYQIHTVLSFVYNLEYINMHSYSKSFLYLFYTSCASDFVRMEYKKIYCSVRRLTK